MTNELEIMLKEAVVDKSDALSRHFPSGPQTTKNVSQASQFRPRSESKTTACKAGQIYF
jgi:hypothetical protein